MRRAGLLTTFFCKYLSIFLAKRGLSTFFLMKEKLQFGSRFAVFFCFLVAPLFWRTRWEHGDMSSLVYIILRSCPRWNSNGHHSTRARMSRTIVKKKFLPFYQKIYKKNSSGCAFASSIWSSRCVVFRVTHRPCFLKIEKKNLFTSSNNCLFFCYFVNIFSLRDGVLPAPASVLRGES